MNVNVFCKAVSSNLGRRLTEVECDSIKEYLAGIRLSPLTSLKLAFKFHLDEVTNELKKIRTSFDSNSLNDLQQQIIGTTSEGAQPDISDVVAISTSESAKLEALFLLEIGEVYNLSKAIAPKSKMKYNYIMLDSANCYDIPDTRDKFTWLIQEEHAKPATGYINLHAKLRNIKMARIGRMTFTHMYGDFVAAADAKNRFGFGFEEFASQALITPSGTKFQFITFLPEFDGVYGTNVTLSPFNANRGWFRFRERFKILDRLTLTITNLFDDTKLVLPAESKELPVILHVGGPPPGNGYTAYAGNSFEVTGLRTEVSLTTRFTSFFLNDLLRSEPMILHFVNGDAGDEAVYDGRIANITAGYGIASEYSAFNEVVGFGALAAPPTELSIRSIYAPRFMGVLELISEDDDDDDSPV